MTSATTTRSSGPDLRLTVFGTGGGFEAARNRAFARAAWICHDNAYTVAPLRADEAVQRECNALLRRG